MQTWYSDVSGGRTTESTYYEFDPWFDATDTFIKEKEKIETMKNKELLEFWNKKQTENAVLYKGLLQ